MGFLSIVVILVLTLFMGTIGPAAAQGNCNGLSDEDCQLLMDSALAMQDVTSVSIPSFSASINLEAEGERVAMSIDGSGVVMLPPNVVAMMSDMPSMTDMTDMTPLLNTLDAIDGAFIQEALAGLLLQFVVDEAMMDTPDEAGSLGAELIVKDSAVYVRLESPNEAEAWFGQTVILTPTDLAEIDAALEELRTELEMFGQNADFSQLMELSAQMADAYAQLGEIAGKHIVTTRGADETIEGQTVAVFTTTFDLMGLLADPDLPAALIAIATHPAMAELMEESGESMDLGTVNETQIQFVLMTAGLLLKDTTITLEQRIGVEDHYLYQTAGQIGMSVDTSLFGGDAAAAPVVVDMAFDMSLADFNAVTPDMVTPPTEFYPLDVDDFIVGSPDMIEGALAVGEPVEDSLDYDDTDDLFSIDLTAGEAISLSVDADDSVSLMIYGPDGFMLADYWDAEEPYSFTADAAGTYLVKLSSYWYTEYMLTVAAG